MNMYQETREIPAEGLSAQHLFWILQETSAAHSDSIGYGEESMRTLGVMWVVIRYYVQVQRWPKAGERIVIQTWPRKEK